MATHSNSLRKGDLVKQKQSGGHIMSVIRIDMANRKIVAGYTTPDGLRQDEEWNAGDLKRVTL